jgi:hypothetical protein
LPGLTGKNGLELLCGFEENVSYEWSVAYQASHWLALPSFPAPKNFIPSSQPNSGMLTDSDNMWKIERRSDGAVVERVPSPSAGDRAIPEAVFAFRQGDPQFIYWDERLRNQENGQ